MPDANNAVMLSTRDSKLEKLFN